jgi:hypothetical protein
LQFRWMMGKEGTKGKLCMSYRYAVIRCSSVSILIDDWGLIPSRARDIYSPSYPENPSKPPSLLSNMHAKTLS